MPAGARFDWHVHEDHQLAWAASGVLTVLTADATWVLPPTRALWIPAGLRHETASATRATMRTLYIRPGAPSYPAPAPSCPAPGPVRSSPVYRAANARVSPASSALRLTARAPCPT